MKDPTDPKTSLTDEFHNLGENIVNVIKAAWDNPERKKLQDEIESGLSEFSATVKREIEEIHKSPTGQQIKSDLDDLQERMKRGTIETKIREDLLSALQTINAELTKTTQKWTSSQGDQKQTSDSNIHEKEQLNGTSDSN